MHGGPRDGSEEHIERLIDSCANPKLEGINNTWIYDPLLAREDFLEKLAKLGLLEPEVSDRFGLYRAGMVSSRLVSWASEQGYFEK